MTPTARSLAYLRSLGHEADVVERRLARTFITKDLFGVIDIVALEPGKVGVLGVQTTSGSNVSARIAKIAAEPRARLWLACGNRLVVHGWQLRGARGQRKLWTVREVMVTDAEHEASLSQQGLAGAELRVLALDGNDQRSRICPDVDYEAA
jgi:hypothetical protein